MTDNKKNPLGDAAENVRRNVFALRKARGLTTERLSTALEGVGHPIAASGITRIEKGDRRVDVDDLVALAAALGARPERLLAAAPGCDTCRDAPPAGFACLACGTGSKT